jgi:hypothetical protein
MVDFSKLVDPKNFINAKALDVDFNGVSAPSVGGKGAAKGVGGDGQAKPGNPTSPQKGGFAQPAAPSFYQE